MNEVYRRKVELLLRILPVVARQEVFAVHGGTAINLFHLNMPRLSVDIDLTYIRLKGRDESLAEISQALLRIQADAQRAVKGLHVQPRLEISKLTCEWRGCQVKIEANQTKRGLVGGEPQWRQLCPKGREVFGIELEVPVVPDTQLFGGKIAAALSRQHPRDLFDVKHMPIKMEGAKLGLIFNLLSSDRPIYESFAPNLVNQTAAMGNQFAGMSDLPFSYADFEETRRQLLADVQAVMTPEDKSFLVSFEEGNPDWTLGYEALAQYPSVKWKLLNISRLKEKNPTKLRSEADKLRDILKI
ncbi:MAG: nucleotidyl transferase AbiEii/AbiGii toxin family protein [Bacteroidales bacterium]|nr:nucleotidyl transferase AbiEii/AbiGii toxin family protein [Bacteroidales bacterium]